MRLATIGDPELGPPVVLNFSVILLQNDRPDAIELESTWGFPGYMDYVALILFPLALSLLLP